VKLLLDENLSAQHAVALRALGHDALAVIEAGLSGEPDTAVRSFAIESGRVLVTLDADFANILRFPPRDTPGVIRLKIHPPSEEAIRELLLRTLHTLREISIKDCLAVAHGEIIRIRS
jgi:predicted nuclease of predicted toxin-antitoxin system